MIMTREQIMLTAYVNHHISLYWNIGKKLSDEVLQGKRLNMEKI